MGDQKIGVEGMTLEDCRRLLGEGRIAESLEGLRALQAVHPDHAALHHYLGVALHLAGRSQDALEHFEKAHELEPGQSTVFQNQAIALLVCGRAEEAIAAAERAIELRPDNIGGYVNLALAQMKLGRLGDVGDTLRRGLGVAPGHPGLLTQAAHLAIEMRDWEQAEIAVAAALRAAPGSLDAHYNAGVLQQARGRDEEAIKEFDIVLSTEPKHEAAFVNKGVCLRNLGRADLALRHFSNGLQIWPHWDVLKYNLAITRLYLGSWSEAWAGYELRAEVAGSLDKSPKPASPKWDGGDIAGRTLLVLHEQGFGDTFQFIRYLGFAAERAGKVIFACQRRLHGLLSRLDLFRSGSIQLVPADGPLPEHDIHIPLMSLPGLARTTPETVPASIARIEFDKDRLARWRDFAAAPPESEAGSWRVGLSWQGNPSSSVDRGRSIPLTGFAPLARLDGKVQFISLQRHFGVDQTFPEGLNIAVPGEDFDAGDEAFVDSAAMMMSLDLVITSDTAVAHLAGMLGRPVWLFLKHAPDWRWGGEGHLTPWYPTMRIFRQRGAGDWTALFEEAANDLDRLIVRESPDSSAAAERIQDAIQLHMQGRFGEAIAIYSAALGSRKGDAQLLNFLGMAILENGKRSPQAARMGLPFAAHSVALRPAVGDFWSNFSVLLDSLGSRNDSKRALRYALFVNPGHVPSLISLAKKESADGNSEHALKTLRELATKHPSTSLFSALATVYSDLGDQREAERAIRRALQSEPEDSKLWVQLGAFQSASEKFHDAAASWERALFQDPANADALSNLGVHERNHGELGISIYLQRRAVECDPQHAEGWNNLGIAELEAGHDEEAINAFRRALTVRPGYPDAHLALGMALLNSGDFDQGLKHYEYRLKADKLGISVNRPNIPYWRGGDPKGLSFFLLAEQGFGDAFQFSRYAAWLKERGAAKVYIGCRTLIGHLLGTVPGVDGVYGEGAKLPKADVMAYLMSMPALTGMRLEAIPSYDSYMRAEPERVTKWAEWLAQKPGFRVGIVWQGNPDPKVDKGRSYPLEALEPLSKVPGVRLIALQKGRGEEQIDALKDRFTVERPGPDFDTGSVAFADTAAMMMNLDLIVTSDTAVAHLAGALGRPCWVVLKANPEWRWLTERSDSPWYPNTRLFRRIKDEVEDRPFAAVMRRMADALGKLVEGDLSQRHVAAPAVAAAVSSFDPVKTYNTALEAQRLGDVKGAEAGFAQVLHVKALRPGALNMLGVLALHKERNHRAVLFFREAERAGLSSSEFLTNYSISLRRTGRIEEAMANLRKAIAQKPTPEAHLSLGNIQRDECHFEDALENYSAAIRMRPTLSKAHRGMGNLMRDMHRPEEALAAFERARELDPGDPDLILDHAHAKLFAGDYVGGFRDYEARWQSKEMKPRSFSVPRWDGSPIGDKVLLVHGEQGFGDNIQFARFVKEAAQRVQHVKVEVRTPLMSLFRTLDAGSPIEIVEQGRETAYDFEVPMLSLPAIFGTTIDTVPPPAKFDIDPARVAAWRERFASLHGLKAGLIWQGNPKARADQGRSPPLSELAPLFDVSGVQFISLQKTDGLDQIKDSPFASRMIVPGQDLGDFHETAAAILALDLVISSCTATLHLAATLGVPVFGMLKYHADWRWLNERSDSPWYPSLRLFQQKTVFDWRSVVDPLRMALAEHAAEK